MELISGQSVDQFSHLFTGGTVCPTRRVFICLHTMLF